jgi:ankyrin repeat protein
VLHPPDPGIHLQFCLEMGQNTNERTEVGSTLLHEAASNVKEKAALNWLLHIGQDIHAMDNIGDSVLHYAAMQAWAYGVGCPRG